MTQTKIMKVLSKLNKEDHEDLIDDIICNAIKNDIEIDMADNIDEYCLTI